MPRKRSRRWTAADARAVFVEQAASGLSLSAFAKREGIDDWRLYKWRRRLDDKKKSRAVAASAPTPAVIELRPSAQRVEHIEIVLASGVTLRVPETIDAAALARLVAALR